MTFTITSQATASTAIPLVMDYAADRASGNIVHRILGRPDPEITLKPLRMRTGTLTCFMGDITAAHDLVEQLKEIGWQRLESTEAAHTNMYFVVSGNIGITTSDETQTFVVTIAFQEVLV